MSEGLMRKADSGGGGDDDDDCGILLKEFRLIKLLVA
jgi:hypothetical protein